MRILITGAAGFIGSHLFQRLSAHGHKIAGIVRSRQPASTASTSRISALAKRQMKADTSIFECGDMVPAKEIAAFKPEACVHLAGRSSVRESIQNPALYEDENGRFSLALLEALRHAGCPRIIHASTVMIYGNDAPLPYHEDAIGCAPAAFYGASKLAVETLMNTWRALHGTPTINLRFFSVYGPELRADCVPHLIASAIASGKEFSVYGDGSSVRDYVDIEDVLDAIENAINVPWRASFPPALNIGSGVGTRLLELVGLIERGLGQKARLIYKPAVAGELQSIVADIGLAQRVLNWSPRVTIGAGISRFTEWFKLTQSRR